MRQQRNERLSHIQGALPLGFYQVFCILTVQKQIRNLTERRVFVLKINIEKRQEAEKILYKVMDALDPSGANTKAYKEMFSTMSDTKFIKFVSSMFDDDTINFTMNMVDYEREMHIEYAENAAKILGIPLEERLILPHLNMDIEHPIVTKTPCIVGWHIDKRMQQTNTKKNSTSIHVSERSATTGQVTGHDKNGRNTDNENAALMVLGAENIAKEFNGFRADGLKRKNAAYASIMTKGYVSLEEVEQEAGIEDRIALQTVDTMYKGMHIQTDLISPDLMTPYTARKGLNNK